jgi:hypothetical protein
MTGIRVLFLMFVTSSFPPRGITRSMYLSWARREEISERVETDWMNVGGMEVVDRALAMRLDMSVAVLMDSFPPLRMAALPRKVSQPRQQAVGICASQGRTHLT